MANAFKPEPPADLNRRTVAGGRPLIAGVPVRDDDIEPTRGLHSIAILFRVLAALLGVIIVLQVLNGLTSAVEISYGVLIAEVIRLVIFAGLLWGAGDLAVLFVKSHDDLRASRILLGRVVNQLSQRPAIEEPRPGEPDSGRGRGDATH
jgi:hypothetical protein